MISSDFVSPSIPVGDAYRRSQTKRLAPAALGARGSFLFSLAGEGSDDLARGGEEGQGDLALRLVLQKVMDNCTIGGILSGVEVLPHLFTRGYLLLTIGRLEGTEEGEILAGSRGHLVAECGQVTGRRARRKEMNAGFAHLIAHLPEGRNVIED